MSSVDVIERDDSGNYWVKINRLFFMKSFVGQILKTILDFNGNQSRQDSSDTLYVNGGDFVTIWASRF